MQPLKLKPVYVERIWGGRGFEKYRDDVPEGKIGERWDVSTHQAGQSIVENGMFAGKTLATLIEEYGATLVGTNVSCIQFPLLVKLIHATDALSVQVHPDDVYAKREENELGKTECWYVLDATPDATLVIGTTNCTKETFKAAALKGELEPLLNTIHVKKGDFFYIPSGLIHAIGEGVVIAEIQQSSDVTYRVYDYNRGRETHLEKALEVADFSLQPKLAISDTLLCSGEYFTVEKLSVCGLLMQASNVACFDILTCVDGSGSIVYDGISTAIALGDSILIPATLGSYEILGELTLLKSYCSYH